MPADPTNLGLREAARLISARRLSPVELLEATIARAERLNPKLGALIAISADSARTAARKAESAASKRGAKLGPLHGVPITIKDLVLTKDSPTTAGSKIFGAGLIADHDAAVVGRVRRAGAIVFAKANLHEIALGVTSVNEHFGPVRNPWDLSRMAGGSSGGSAAAVATGLGQGSIGTDTRGSIRIPAACCGVTGFKPTFGLVSAEGVVPLAHSLDHVGPIARSVEDAAVLFGAMVGKGSVAAAAIRAIDRKPKRMTIAVAEYFLRDADPEIGLAIEQAVRQLDKMGHEIVSVTIPELESALEASRVIVLAEAIAFHDAHLKRIPEGYGPGVKSRLEGGYQLTALQLVRAEERRALLVAAYTELFRAVDILLAPTLPIAAPPIGTQSVTLGGTEYSIAEAFCRANAPQNLTGVPAMSIPCGQTRRGLPMGLQIISGFGRDSTVLALGGEYQRATGLIPWKEQRTKGGS